MKEIILFNLLYISKNIKIKLFTKKGWVLMFKRVNQKTKPKEMKKTYNAKPSKYILIMGSLLLVYLFFFLKDMMLYEKIPPMDEGRIVITATLGTSFLLIFISTLLVLLSNSNKTIVLTPIYCEYSNGNIRFNTHWRELQPESSSFCGYKWLILNGVIPDKKGNRKDITAYVDSIFFKEYDDMLNLINKATATVAKSAIDIS